jgi:hypothetical protein
VHHERHAGRIPGKSLIQGGNPRFDHEPIPIISPPSPAYTSGGPGQWPLDLSKNPHGFAKNSSGKAQNSLGKDRETGLNEPMAER